MNKALIIPVECDGSPLCPARRSCKQKAIIGARHRESGRTIMTVDESKCTGCGACLAYCPRSAIRMTAAPASRA